jgi:hypothetical protein
MGPGDAPAAGSLLLCRCETSLGGNEHLEGVALGLEDHVGHVT